ncbi:C40 family peptidase [Cytophaga aurantiaca]|uniref:C40 family peptidase n=1 Tax=Cytophaga aurantiaca TaxID=29530 RepID=UPI00037C171F|nr:C40 family peptidase [Cytophaga aurantiaca]
MRHVPTIFLLSISLLLSCKSSKVSSSKDAENKKQKETTKGNIHESSEKADKVIKAARSYIGTPYKYGGTSRAGMDCSGLMLLCFKEVNIDLPRTSIEQSNVGTSIKYADLRPGDLVFFTDKKGNSKVVHAGLVSKVNGPRDVKFIHSSTKLGVVESDLYVSYYESILVKARRVL